MMRVLTDVFPENIKPVRNGWYLTSQTYGGIVGQMWSLRYWNGEDWCSAWGEPYRLQEMWSWRGLAFDPAAAEPEIDAETGQSGVFVPGAVCE